jgi:hypothetical protein
VAPNYSDNTSTLFSNVHQKGHQCHIFEGKRKLLPLPMKPISVESPFQQWKLDFIGEIHLGILIATNYFTMWIKAVPCRKSTDSIIIKFLETKILSHFGCPRKIITNNKQL